MGKQRQKYIANLDTKQAERLTEVLSRIISLQRTGLDIIPLSWEKNSFRCRVGTLRIVFSMENKKVKITKIGPRWDVYK